MQVTDGRWNMLLLLFETSYIWSLKHVTNDHWKGYSFSLIQVIDGHWNRLLKVNATRYFLLKHVTEGHWNFY
jgi:hypothetical protein